MDDEANEYGMQKKMRNELLRVAEGRSFQLPYSLFRIHFDAKAWVIGMLLAELRPALDPFGGCQARGRAAFVDAL